MRAASHRLVPTRPSRRTRRGRRLLALVGALLVALPLVPANAATGDLDATFGTNGVSVSVGFMDIDAILPLPKGKLLLGDYGGVVIPMAADGTWGPGVNTGAGVMRDLIRLSGGKTLALGTDGVARLLSDLSLDPKFGTAGLVTTTDLGGIELLAAASLKGGKVLVAGRSSTDMVLKRLNSDGTADVTFGSAGTKTVSCSAGTDRAYSLLVSGSTYFAAGVANGDFALATVSKDGATATCDTASTGSSVQWAKVMAVGGRLVLAGQSYNPTGEGFASIATAGFTTAGAKDTTYGTDGVSIVSAPGGLSLPSYQADVATATSKIIVGGYETSSGNSRAFLVRLSSDGSLDTTWDSDGLKFLTGADASTEGRTVTGLDGYSVRATDKGYYLGGLTPDESYAWIAKLIP